MRELLYNIATGGRGLKAVNIVAGIAPGLTCVSISQIILHQAKRIT